MQTTKYKLFKNSNIYKSTFTLFSLLSILALSIFILFQIEKVPLSEKEMFRSGNKIMILFVLWYGGFVLNKNLHLSNRGDIPSYILAITLNGALIAFVFYRINVVPEDFYGYLNNHYFYLGLMSYQILWTAFIAFFERKNRPYFSLHLLYKVIASILLLIIILVGYWNFDRYYLGKHEYKYLDSSNLSIILFMPIVLILYLWASYKSYKKLSKYAKSEKDSAREIMMLNAFVRVISIMVWSINSVGIWDDTFNKLDKIFLAISSLIIFVTIFSIIVSIMKKQTRFLVHILTINLIIMTTSGFVFVNTLGATPSNTFFVFMLYITIFLSTFIFLKPRIYKFYSQLNSLLSYFLILFGLLIWAGDQFIGEINFFNINEIIWGILIFISASMFVLYMGIDYIMALKTNIRFIHLIKIYNRKGKIKKKKVLNGQ